MVSYTLIFEHLEMYHVASLANVGNVVWGGHASVPACIRRVAEADGAHIEHVLKQP